MDPCHTAAGDVPHRHRHPAQGISIPPGHFAVPVEWTVSTGAEEREKYIVGDQHYHPSAADPNAGPLSFAFPHASPAAAQLPDPPTHVTEPHQVQSSGAHRGLSQHTDLESATFSPPVLCVQPYTVWDHFKRRNRPHLGPVEACSHPRPANTFIPLSGDPKPNNQPSPGRPDKDLYPNSIDQEALSTRSPHRFEEPARHIEQAALDDRDEASSIKIYRNHDGAYEAAEVSKATSLRMAADGWTQLPDAGNTHICYAL